MSTLDNSYKHSHYAVAWKDNCSLASNIDTIDYVTYSIYASNYKSVQAYTLTVMVTVLTVGMNFIKNILAISDKVWNLVLLSACYIMWGNPSRNVSECTLATVYKIYYV